ncbi:hypothetical protein L7F22_024370 [Adiantum nelumboides]|nr:hypothetical protein [Adiantum nelumboides]
MTSQEIVHEKQDELAKSPEKELATKEKDTELVESPQKEMLKEHVELENQPQQEAAAMIDKPQQPQEWTFGGELLDQVWGSNLCLLFTLHFCGRARNKKAATCKLQHVQIRSVQSNHKWHIEVVLIWKLSIAAAVLVHQYNKLIMQSGDKVVVVGDRFCAPFEVVLVVAQKKATIGSDDFVVKDAQDREVFKIDSHALSLHNKKVLMDQAGHPILCFHKAKVSALLIICSKFLLCTGRPFVVLPDRTPILRFRSAAFLMSAHEKWEASLGDHFNEQTKRFRVQKAKAVQFKTHLEVFLAENQSDDSPDFIIKGNYFEREVQICRRDEGQIAEVTRKLSVANVLLDKHAFYVRVGPNVDQAFIVALVVIMDEIQD